MDNGTKRRTALRVFGISVLACAVIGALLRTISLFFFYDADIGYYSMGAVLPTVFNVIMIIAALACAVLCFIPKIALTSDNFGESKAADILYAIPCLISVYAFIVQLKLIGQYSELGLTLPRIQLFMLIFNVFAIAYWALSIFRSKINKALFVITGIFTMLWLMLILVDQYFDMYVQINSPNKTLMAFALVSAVLFISGEIRLPIDEKKHGVRLFSSSIAVICLAISSIPTIIAHFGGAFGASYSVSLGDTVCLALLIPVCARFIKLCFGKKINAASDNESRPE